MSHSTTQEKFGAPDFIFDACPEMAITGIRHLKYSCEGIEILDIADWLSTESGQTSEL